MKLKKFLFLFLFSLFTVMLYAQQTEAQQAEAQEIPFAEEDSGLRNEMPEESAEETEGGLASEEAAEAEGNLSESEGGLPSEAAAEPVPLSPEMQRVELEIKTSSLPELAAWSRTLGLSEGGTRTDLAKRLREHFSLPAPGEPDENQKVITIESAQTTEYFTIDVIDEDYARLRGGVVLSLRDKDSVHKISAGEVLFNRTRNILTASGGVEYRKEKDDTTEIFRGENITVNIDDWSTIFLDGESERKLSTEDTTYRFEGTVITRSNDDVMILKDSKVSKANNEDALWSISASKLWLLPGSDFAIFNGVLKVGEIPVLYIPFFYYPADEVIFHPVIGFRDREGAFVQTTTYILGRPKVDDKEKSSLTRILGNSNDMEKERHGLFLKSTGKKLRDPNTLSLKLLLDYYSNLGLYLGLDLATPKKGILNPMELSLGFGFTRTLTKLNNGNHTPYAPNFDGTFDWNQSNFFSATVPFRYRLKTSSSIGGKYGSLSWSIPFYSDPFVDIDFLNRSENMDWVNMIQQGAELDDNELTKQEVGDYQWQLNGSINPLVSALSPAISRMSISNLSILNFKKIENSNNTNNTNSEDPGRYFFAPDKYTIYSFSSSVSGTPLTIGGVQTASSGAASSGANTETPQETTDPLKGFGIPRPPWPVIEESKEEEAAAAGEKLVPPVLNVSFDLPKLGSAKFFVDYTLSPTGSSVLQFMSNSWQKAEDVNWNDVQSVITNFGGSAIVNFNLNHSGGLFTNKFSFEGKGTWRDFTFLNEEADAFLTPQGEPDEEKIKKAREDQYKETNYQTSYSYIGTVKPLYYNAMFGQTSFQYTFKGALVESKKYSGGDGPELTPEWGAWVKGISKDNILGLTQHKLSANLAANIMDKPQNINIITDLPPLDPFISINATFNAWISKTDARISFKKPENETNEKWIIDPFDLTETLTFSSFGKATFFMRLEPEKNNEITQIKANLSLWKLVVEYVASESSPMEFVYDYPDFPALGGEWLETDDKPSLNPNKLSFNYNHIFAEKKFIKDRLTFSMHVNTELSFNLQQYTNSFFNFGTGFTLGINNFLKMHFEVRSQNRVVFRYFKNIPGMEDLTAMYPDGPQNNVFTDLIDSFNFFDNTKRESSGFKMKNFSLKLEHFLGDWTANLEITMSPELNKAILRYEMNTDIKFSVKWSAIQEIKTDMEYNSKEKEWKVK